MREIYPSNLLLKIFNSKVDMLWIDKSYMKMLKQKSYDIYISIIHVYKACSAIGHGKNCFCPSLDRIRIGGGGKGFAPPSEFEILGKGQGESGGVSILRIFLKNIYQ